MGAMILVAGGAFALGFTVALWLGPAIPDTPAGSPVFLVSRLVVGAGVAVAVLEAYAAIRQQALAAEILREQRPSVLSGRLSVAGYHAGVLIGLGCALAALGTRLRDQPAPGHRSGAIGPQSQGPRLR